MIIFIEKITSKKYFVFHVNKKGENLTFFWGFICYTSDFEYIVIMLDNQIQ